MTTTNQLTYEAATTLLMASLIAGGWEPCDGAAVASKTYQTAVGPKVAHAYMQQWQDDEGSHGVTLSCQYHSEGRNVTESDSALVQLGASAEAVTERGQRFCRNVDHTVRNSYAARLLTAA